MPCICPYAATPPSHPYGIRDRAVQPVFCFYIAGCVFCLYLIEIMAHLKEENYFAILQAMPAEPINPEDLIPLREGVQLQTLSEQELGELGLKVPELLAVKSLEITHENLVLLAHAVGKVRLELPAPTPAGGKDAATEDGQRAGTSSTSQQKAPAPLPIKKRKIEQVSPGKADEVRTIPFIIIVHQPRVLAWLE